MSSCRPARLGLTLGLFLTIHSVQSQEPFSLDLSFRTAIQSQYVSDLHILADGSLLLSGRIQQPAGGNHRGTSRLFSNGDVDASFPPFPLTAGGGTITPWQNGCYIGNGQIVRRLDSSGLLDNTFIMMNDGPYFSSLQGGDYHVYPDGRILMSGAHILRDSIRGFEGLYSLIWFSNEGYLDTTRTHRYCDGVIYDIAEQPDGKFLCTGTMNTYEDQPVSRVFRVHPDGALDTSFNTPVEPWGGAFDYHTLSDGRILAAGFFKQQGASDTLGLLRLWPDGSIDHTFHSCRPYASFAPNPLGYLLDVYELPDGRLIVCGRFDRLDGQVRGGIALLNTKGELLDEFFTGSGCGPYEYVEPSGSSIYKGITGIVPAPDGSFYIYGAYHGYDDGTTNDTTQRFVSRLYGLDVGVQEQESEAVLSVFPNPSNGRFQVRSSRPLHGAPVRMLDLTGKSIRAWTWPAGLDQAEFNTEGLAAGHYVLVVDAGQVQLHVALTLSP